MSRQLPTMCKHERVSDWGDFGLPNAGPEPCPWCRRDVQVGEVRDLVFRQMVKAGHADPLFAAAVDAIGFFRLVAVVDTITASLDQAYREGAPLASVESTL